MLRNSNINDSGLSSTGRQPDNDIDGNFFTEKFDRVRETVPYLCVGVALTLKLSNRAAHIFFTRLKAVVKKFEVA